MEALNSLECHVCFSPYDNLRAPRIIPCNNGHSICSICLENILATREQVFRCPFDRVQIKIQNRTIEAFPKNLALQELVSSFGASEFCQMHAFSKLDLICLGCQTKICYKCEKLDHRGHKTEMLCEIPKKIAEKMCLFKKCIESVEEIERNKDKIIEAKEDELLQEVNDNFEVYINELRKKKEEVSQKIKAHFETLREKENYQSSDGFQLVQWKENTKKILQEMDWEKEFEQTGLVPYDLFEQEDTLSMLNIEEWTRLEENNIQNLNLLLDTFNVSFNRDSLDLIKNKKFAEFEPEKEPTKNPGEIKELKEKDLHEEKKSDFSSENPSENFEDSQKKSRATVPEKITGLSKLSFEEKDRISHNINKKIEYIKKVFQNIEIQVLTKSYSIKLETSEWSLLNDSTAYKLNRSLNKLPENIREFIQEIDFQCENFTNRGLNDIGYVLSYLTSLKLLHLSFQKANNMTTGGLRKFEEILCNLKNLTNLHFDFQRWVNLNDFSLEIIAKSIATIQSLTSLTLNLSDCWKVTNNGILQLFKALEGMGKLLTINLLFKGCKKMNNDHLEEIQESFTKLTNLKELTLDFSRCPLFVPDEDKPFFKVSQINPQLKFKLYKDW